MKSHVLAADLGGTNLRMAVVDHDGRLASRFQVATPVERSRGEIVNAITDLASKCVKDRGIRPAAFGVTAPAIISASNGTIFSSPNLPDLNGFDLAGEVALRLRMPAFLENDANAAAVGESWLGASRGVSASICVTLGTGVGGGLILDRRLVRGIDGTAGEIGHIAVVPDGFECGCGSRGCLEQYASATAISRFVASLSEKFPESVLARIDKPSAAEVFQAGMAGDRLAIKVFEQVGMYLGVALAGLINVVNPEVIVIGGGVSAGWDLFAPRLRTEIEFRAFRQPAERVKLVRAALGGDAGILGVARLAFDRAAAAA